MDKIIFLFYTWTFAHCIVGLFYFSNTIISRYFTLLLVLFFLYFFNCCDRYFPRFSYRNSFVPYLMLLNKRNTRYIFSNQFDKRSVNITSIGGAILERTPQMRTTLPGTEEVIGGLFIKLIYVPVCHPSQPGETYKSQQ